MKILFVAALMLVACSMAHSHAIPFKAIPWLKEILEENEKTHCFDEYLNAHKKIQIHLMGSMNQCAKDHRSGREIIKCVNQLVQSAALELQQTESLICPEPSNQEAPEKENNKEAPVEEGKQDAPHSHHDFPFKAIPWLKEILEENEKTHCFDEYLNAHKKIQLNVMDSMNQCAKDHRSGREIIKCINQLVQSTASELQQTESLICPEPSNQETPEEENNHEAPVQEGNQETPAEENNQEAPVEEGNQEAPAEENNQEAPVEEGNQAAPAEESSQ